MSIVTIGYTVYVALAAIYIVSENRRPQSAFAWMFLFLTLPVAGLVVYVLFGRMRGGVGRTRRLVRQTPSDQPGSLYARALAEHERAMERLPGRSALQGHLGALVSATTEGLVTTSNRVEVLQGAAEKYPPFFADLRAAETSIHLQYYIWRPDALGEELRALLTAKAAAGVAVRVLYDPVGSLGLRMALYVRRMRRGGVQMRPASPLWRVHTISYRNHRKIAVIDGRIGYAGGINLGDEHLHPGPRATIWRDTHLRLTGMAVRALQGVFMVDWTNATKQRLGDDLLPPLGEDEGDLPVQLVVSGPDSEWRAIRQQYFGMISRARTRLRVQTPYFILEESLGEALKTAAMSGVDVSVMVTEGGYDQRLVYWAGRTYLSEIARAGVEVLVYKGGFLHAKTVVADGGVASIGSGNWDIRSFSINYELNVLIYDDAIAGQIEAAYEHDRASCVRFDHEAYRASSRLGRFRDSVARLVSPLL